MISLQLELHKQAMKCQARHDQAARVLFGTIKSDSHREVLDRAVKNVLSTELAILTYAQILDGLPTADVAWDRRFPGISGDHIIDDVHKELCPVAVTTARELYETWDISTLRFGKKLVERYQEAVQGSRDFNLRLIELVAVALHQIEVMAYKLDLRLHSGEIQSVIDWKMPRFSSTILDIPPRTTLFNHPFYLEEDVYPEGRADVVGYWAEDRILGGVAVFDRSSDRQEEEAPNVYFHSSRDRVTHRVYQLRNDQQRKLTQFLLVETPSPTPSPCPLPILADPQNRIRVDSQIAIFPRRIYRDIWERMPVTMEEFSFLARRPQEELDYPELRLAIISINRAADSQVPQFRPRTPSPDFSLPPRNS